MNSSPVCSGRGTACSPTHICCFLLCGDGLGRSGGLPSLRPASATSEILACESSPALGAADPTSGRILISRLRVSITLEIFTAIVVFLVRLEGVDDLVVRGHLFELRGVLLEGYVGSDVHRALSIHVIGPVPFFQGDLAGSIISCSEPTLVDCCMETASTFMCGCQYGAFAII